MDFTDDDFGPTPFSSAGGSSSNSGQQQQQTFSNPPGSDGPTELARLTRVPTAPAGGSGSGTSSPDETLPEEVVSVRCPRGQRDYYTVIKNVKRAHQIQDSGEFQEFNDDVDYIQEGLGAKNSLSTR